MLSFNNNHERGLSVSYHIVVDLDEVRKQIMDFKTGMTSAFKDEWEGQRARSSIYWVKDSATGDFAVAKFAGYYPVDMDEYIYSHQNGSAGPRRGGGQARLKIEGLTGNLFKANAQLETEFMQWAQVNMSGGFLKVIDLNKLKFMVI